MTEGDVLDRADSSPDSSLEPGGAQAAQGRAKWRGHSVAPDWSSSSGLIERPMIPVVEEGWVRRWLFGVVMLGVLVLYGLCVGAYWHPAHPGVDQNGYLVGGKLLAGTGSTGFVPGNAFSFVGNMWNLGPDGKTFYPKYPLGLPAIYAMCVKLMGIERGAWWAYVASPAGAVAALLATYLLARPLVGAFGAVLAALVVGTSPITMGLANNPNSHATTLAFTTLGMAMLFSWWRSGGWWRGVLAGTLCGYAVTIRYTEGLLLLPMVFVFVDRWFRRQRGAYWEGLVMFAGWSVPVGALLWFNFLHFGSPTGYDSTRESFGFGWEYAVANWDLMIRDMNDKGLMLLFPLGLAGMGLMAAAGRGMWKVGAVLALWAIPCLVTYTAYYWAPDGASIGYSRFFLSILPAIAVAGVWVLVRVGELLAGLGGARASGAEGAGSAGGGVGGGGRWWGSAFVAGGVVAIATATAAQVNSETTIPESRINMVISSSADHLRKRVPAGSVVLADQRLMHHLQFVAEYELYSADIFSRAVVQRLAAQAEVDDPNPIQPQRAAALYALLKDKTEAQLIAEQNRIMDEAIKGGRRVFFVGAKTQVDAAKRRLVAPGRYETKVLDQWQEPADLRRTRWQRAGAVQPTWTGRRREVPARDAGQMWQVLEVTAKPEPPAKVSPPASRPATRLTSSRPVGPTAGKGARRESPTARSPAVGKPATPPTTLPATAPRP